MKRKFLFLLFLIFSVAVFLITRENRELEKDFRLKGDSFIEGLKIVQKKNGNNIWVLNAKRADIVEKENKAMLSNIEILITEKEMKIRAADGLYDMSGKKFTLLGNIIADTKDYTIIANTAEWTSNGEIKTKGDVKIEGRRFTIQGVGIEANSGQKVRILKDVKAVFYR
ncbi:MAG: LPS export ABC transporter periplasmic protein LptC [Nitrospiraceae bacterium]|nr:LPS export ABC transporter periplasmic protein LptC [Nitrospiraceae bacterium]